MDRTVCACGELIHKCKYPHCGDERIVTTQMLRDQDAQRIAELEAELERERMRLAACGVVALADTPESAIAARRMNAEYRSGSCDDVARRVDECIALRAERDALKAELKDLRNSIVASIKGQPCPTPAQWKQMQVAIDAAKGEK